MSSSHTADLLSYNSTQNKCGSVGSSRRDFFFAGMNSEVVLGPVDTSTNATYHGQKMCPHHKKKRGGGRNAWEGIAEVSVGKLNGAQWEF